MEPSQAPARTRTQADRVQALADALPALARPDGALISLQAQPQPRLAGVSDWELGMEMLARLTARPETWRGNQNCWLGAKLQFALRKAFNVHENRFALRRYLDLYGVLHGMVDAKLPLRDATFVDLGCGGVNPLGLLFVFLALGARRGIGVDLDEVQDVEAATMALADVASAMVIDSASIAWRHAIPGDQVLRNLASFDLGKLRVGDPSGIDAERLRFCKDSLYAMSIGDSEADVVMSNAFLEHIPDVRRGVREIARITKPGGYSVHNIDISDHRRYAGIAGPLDFLEEQAGAEMVAGSNRLRAHQFVEIFESEGFEVTTFAPREPAPMDALVRARFVEPFRSMKLEQLAPMMVLVVARRL